MMILVDHDAFVINILYHIRKGEQHRAEGLPAVVTSGKEQQLLNKAVHIVCFLADGGYALVKDFLVLFAPFLIRSFSVEISVEQIVVSM